MCGIVGYVGHREASQFLIEGLRRLEYRGYDSSGVAAIDSGGQLAITKTKGRIEDLVACLARDPIGGKIGVGHTRWATHGQPSDENAHPHVGGSQVLAIVHNGVIENYQQLKARLVSEGYTFQSATDSEIIGHLISDHLEHASDQHENQQQYEPHLWKFLCPSNYRLHHEPPYGSDTDSVTVPDFWLLSEKLVGAYR